jgi:two-component system, NarL family, nitrate/nitrite response regulator NarL
MTEAIRVDESLATRSVLVIDDHELVGASIAMVLVGAGFRAFQCPVTTTASIVRVAERTRPDLVLLDLDLGLGSGAVRVDELELIRSAKARGIWTLVVSATSDMERVAAAVAAGAIGFVAKGAALHHLLDTVRDAASGRAVLTPTERARWLDLHRRAQTVSHANQARLERLSAREREILDLLAHGERAAAIAAAAVVSLSTVRSQIRSILTKLEVNSQLEAVALVRPDTA